MQACLAPTGAARLLDHIGLDGLYRQLAGRKGAGLPAGDAPRFQAFQQFPVPGAPGFLHFAISLRRFVRDGGAAIVADPYHVEIEIANVGLDPQPHVVVAPLRFLDMRHAAFDKLVILKRAVASCLG